MAAKFMSTVLPTDKPLPSASVRDTITVFGWARSSSDPYTMSMFMTSEIVDGSTPVRKVSDEPACASAWRSTDTVENWRLVERSFASCGENGANWFEDSVKSAPST